MRSLWSGAKVTEAHIDHPFQYSIHIGAQATFLLRMDFPRLVLVLVLPQTGEVVMRKSKWKLDAGGGEFRLKI